jgi:cobalamin biosynthesis protein CobD/CbiB
MNKTKKEVNRWRQAATVLAFTALGLIAFSYWIGTDTWIKCVMVLVTSVFFATGIIWWYWVLNQISQFAKYIASLKDVIRELKEDLKNIRKGLD